MLHVNPKSEVSGFLRTEYPTYIEYIVPIPAQAEYRSACALLSDYSILDGVASLGQSTWTPPPNHQGIGTRHENRLVIPKGSKTLLEHGQKSRDLFLMKMVG